MLGGCMIVRSYSGHALSQRLALRGGTIRAQRTHATGKTQQLTKALLRRAEIQKSLCRSRRVELARLFLQTMPITPFVADVCSSDMKFSCCWLPTYICLHGEQQASVAVLRKGWTDIRQCPCLNSIAVQRASQFSLRHQSLRMVHSPACLAPGALRGNRPG